MEAQMTTLFSNIRMFPFHEKNYFLSFRFGLHLMWVYLHVVWELKQKLMLLFWLDCVCCSVRSQRKCRWSASGLPLHGCCSQPVWWRPQPEAAQPNAVIESVEVAGIQLEETVYLLTASPQSWVASHNILYKQATYVFLSRARCWGLWGSCLYVSDTQMGLLFLCLLLPSVLVWDVLMRYIPLRVQ